ncbi:MAG: cupin domain-containing protein [Candidatus Omnitrophica bacterium]|nr:cupin domain-containing protein [Candidatus Omnitrophota bacterium]
MIRECNISAQLFGIVRLLFLVFCVTSCAHKPARSWQAVFPDNVLTPIPWTEEEFKGDPVTRTLDMNEDSSFHLIRLIGSERPHTHDTHDLYAFMISGSSKLVSGGRESVLNPGDAAYVPRGTIHWAENLAPEGSEAYVVFVPALNEPDYREIGKRTL